MATYINFRLPEKLRPIFRTFKRIHNFSQRSSYTADTSRVVLKRCICYSWNDSSKYWKRIPHMDGGRLLLALGMCRAFLGFKKKENKLDDITILLYQAKQAVKSEEYEEAEKLYHQALYNADQLLKNKEIEEKQFTIIQTHVFSGMGNMSLECRKLEVAEKLFKETLKYILKLGYTEDSNGFIDVSLTLAGIYAMLKRTEDARTGYLYCIEVQEKKVDEKADDINREDGGLLGMALESYARFLVVEEKNYKKGEELYLRSLEICKKLKGAEDDHALDLMNDIASLRLLQKDNDGAHQILEPAVEVARRTKSKELPVLYCNLGALHLRRDDVGRAEDVCQDALRLATKLRDFQSAKQAQNCLSKVKELKDKKGNKEDVKKEMDKKEEKV